MSPPRTPLLALARPALLATLFLACTPPEDAPLDDRAQDISAGGIYVMRGVGSGKCVDVTGNSTVAGTNVEQWDCNGQPNQQWKFNSLGNGYYEIRPMSGTGQCLDVYQASLVNGGNVDQWTCNGHTSQHFKIVQPSSGKYTLIAQNSGKCLDVYQGSTARGANIQQWGCNGQTNQQFTFTALDPLPVKPDAGVDAIAACVPETDTTFCARLGKTCGAFSGTDNCGKARTVAACGMCGTGQTCGTTNVCVCAPETDAAFCARLGKTCGAFSGTDNCGQPRNVMSCGACGTGQTCGTTNVCVTNPTTLVHPGILVSQAQLDFVKAHLGSDPWKSALASLKGSHFASLTYTASPIADVDCGPYSMPDVGCSQEKDDVIAAYSDALLWYFTRDTRYAAKAIEIMNAWSAVLQEHTNSNAPLQAAWAASIFPRAAEIIRWTYTGWAQADQDRFAQMLRTAYLPLIVNGAPNDNGNWELAMIEATMNIAIFLDDRTTFDKATSMWKKRVPAYIYMTSDGPLPVPPPNGSKNTQSSLISYWYGQTTFVDGVGQETCRDFGHLQMGFASMAAAAETARVQGVDLWGAQAARIRAGWEFAAQYMNGAAVPSWLCGGTLNLSNDPTWEIAYNHLVNRLGLQMPQAQQVIGRIRPTGATHQMAWETLTHAETGKTQ